MKKLAEKTVNIQDLVISKNGYDYQLNEYWSIDDNANYEFNNKSQDNAFIHGGVVIGDGKVKSRTIDLTFAKRGATEQEYNEAVNTAYRYLSQVDYYLRSGRSDRKYFVNCCKKIKAKYEKGFANRWAEVTATLILAEEPFRLATTETTNVIELAEAVTDHEITLVNNGSADSALIIAIEPTEGTLSSCKIVHIDNAEMCSISDTLLQAPKVTTINGKAGTVRRDEENSINTFTGVFLHILAGTNTYKITTNNACKITFTYNARYFV